MTRTEVMIQLLKIALGLAFGAYFVWWSLQVLDRLTPEYDEPANDQAAELGQHCFCRMDFAAPGCLNKVAISSWRTDHEKAGSAWNYRWCRVLDGGSSFN
jgi:hypothetical protein